MGNRTLLLVAPFLAYVVGILAAKLGIAVHALAL